MLKKFLVGGAIASALLLAGCSSTTSSSSSSKESAASTSTSMSSSMSTSESKMATSNMMTAGEIIGNFNSDDMKTVGATKPGDSVMFKIPMPTGSEEYLHFAFMHAASGAKGWYFAPKDEKGIMISKDMLSKGEMDITDQIGLFSAPNATTAAEVTKDDGDLKYGMSSDFLKATIKASGDMYEVTIMNNSTGDHETPFSSGVWQVASMGEKSFDHMASEALSTLATSGHRDELYKMVMAENK